MTRWIVPLVAGAVAVAAAPSGLPVRLQTRSEIKSRVANVHVEYEREVEGSVTFTYGPCSSKELRDVHHTILEAEAGDNHRLVWIVPEDAESSGCLQAWNEDGSLIGRSEPQSLRHYWKRRVKRQADPIHMTEENGFSPIGAWFEGVKLLEDKQPSPVDVEAAKAKEVAIVGAGMSGLMTWLILEQAGLKNVTILEGSQRLGGRVRTQYLSGGPFDYSYQEMGPMRFPYQYTNPRTGEKANITDQQVIYQLADELNKLNGNDPEYYVKFIEWFNSNPNSFTHHNDFKLPNGLPPTVAQVAQNASLGPPAPPPLPESAEDLEAAYNALLPAVGGEFFDLMAENMFKAHEEWTKNGLGGIGGDVWSEYSFLVNYLGGSLNDTDALGFLPADYTHWHLLSILLYFVFGDWRTIDGGLNRLPNAFGPLLGDSISFGRRIERIKHHSCSNRVELIWRDDFTSKDFHNATFDYAVISAPFPIVRGWRMPQLGTTITNAIQKMPYDTACKVALEYSERFWEKYENPIYGGCSTTTDIPGVQSICYPSYNLNGTGPATILASYSTGHWGLEWLTRSEEEHVQYVLDAMTDIHGEDTRELYTGKYNRHCWQLDPFTAGGWANPTVGMHQLYIPEYHKTHKNMIFVGEHTSITHAWVNAAVESGIRGGVQMLLELGLVDEANEAVDKWMARWIDI